MKRVFSVCLFTLAAARVVWGYDNSAQIVVPPMDPRLIQIDAANGNAYPYSFVNEPGALFSISQDFNPYKARDVMNYTNHGTMVGVPGFDFQFFSTNDYVAQPGVSYNGIGAGQMASSFVNEANGPDGGVINCAGIFSGFFGVLTPGQLLLTEDASLAGKCLIAASNIVHSGQINMDASGLIKMMGQDIDLTRGSLTMATPNQLFLIDLNGNLVTFNFGNAGILDGYWGVGQQTTNNLIDPAFFNSLPTFSPFHLVTTRNFGIAIEQLYFPTNSQVYVYDSGVVGSNRLVQVIFLNDTNSTMTKTIYFNPGIESVVQWSWPGVDYTTGEQSTNYLYLTDDFGETTNLSLIANGVSGVNNTYMPINYQFVEGTPYNTFSLIVPTPPSTTPLNIFNNVIVSNAWSAYEALFTPSGQSIGDVAGQNVTNLSGRIEITADNTLDLTRTHISALAYTLLKATNHFKGNSGAVIESPYLDIILRSTNGTMTSSNLIVPNLPSPSGYCDVDSERWIEVDASGVTNRFHVLFVNSQINPLAPLYIQTLSLKATNAISPAVDSIFISDILNVTSNLLLDAEAITVTSNSSGAFTPVGQLNTLSPYITWSAATPRLRYLTNSGILTASNLVNYAGNMSSPYDSRSVATPYETFINHGGITNQGAFIYAKYFENEGWIQENLFGSIDINAHCARMLGVKDTNSVLNAPSGRISINADSLVVSNHNFVAGAGLILNITNCLTDLFALGNQFGAIVTSNSPANVISNGNTWSVAGNLTVRAAAVGDLLGTTITNIAGFNNNYTITWPGVNYGITPAGFGNNLALGRLVLNGTTNSAFTVVGANGNNALYVDSLEIVGSMTNTTASGDLKNVTVAPGMKVYYAQALMNGVSVAEKLNGKNGGGFLWVSNYAGVYSSTNLSYTDGNTYIFNAALAASCDISSGGADGTGTSANCSAPFGEPIPTNWVFVTSISEPLCDCDPGFTPPSGPDPGPGTNKLANVDPMHSLPYPGQTSVSPNGNSSNTVSFTAAQGAYNGLFYETNGVTPARSGLFSAKVTATGNFSARLQLAASIYAISGQFDANGNWAGTATGKGLAPVQLSLVLSDNQIVGTVSKDDWTAELWSDRAGFSSQHPTSLAGRYTLVFGATTNGTSSGNGFGIATVDKTGNVQWSGTLADGTKVSQKSALSVEGIWPLYSPLYSGAGSLISWMQITNQSTNGVPAFWILPSGTRSLISSGLTNEVAAKGSPIIGALGITRGMVVLSGGGLAAPITNYFKLSAGKVVSSDASLTLSVSTASGLFKGATINPATNQKISFQGALLEKKKEGSGYFINAGQSGRVELNSQ